ncbi:MAG: RNA polymerase factor sigma-32 [Rickettsiaceae bacterium H1]|nr:RNA polymerase factor sigma-32 [Rickettsiaceae bacterium H1]
MSSNLLLQDQAFSEYISKVAKFPILSELEEKKLVMRWVNSKDVKVAHKLVTSHLRLVVKIALQFRNYGFALMELVSEGTVGLMKAVKSFDPEAGCRVCTYAMWWIKSAIQEYILKSWSLVKIGTTNAQRKLFFNLRKLQKKLLNNSQIAEELSVDESEVEQMHYTLSGNGCSLDRENEISNEVLTQEGIQEKEYAERECLNHKRGLLVKALDSLDKRYREILIARKLQEKPVTLSALSKLYKISSERVRQIEEQAMKKVKKFILQEPSFAD